MKLSTLNRLRWISVFLSLVLFVSGILFVEVNLKNNTLEIIFSLTLGISWIIANILILISFFYKRSTIKHNVKLFILLIIPVSLVLWLVFGFLKYTDIIDYLRISSLYILILSIILTIICFLERIEMILLILIFISFIGFVLNRVSVSDIGPTTIQISFSISSFGFFCLSLLSLKTIKENKTKGRIFIVFYIIIGVLFALLFIKFASDQSDFRSILDTIGVIIFLAACLALFIALPFSNFPEWTDPQKKSFKRLILLPFILFLLIFALRFLLSQSTYRKVFYKESIRKESVHFHMEDYKLDFNKK